MARLVEDAQNGGGAAEGRGPRAATDAIRLSRRTLATIGGHLFRAFGYNVAVFVVSDPLRLRGFAPLPEDRDAATALPSAPSRAEQPAHRCHLPAQSTPAHTGGQGPTARTDTIRGDLMSHHSSRATRPAAAGAAAGLALLTRPHQVLDAVAPTFPRKRAWLVRALGARMLVQHATVLVRPGPGVVTAGVVLDVLHAASMLPFLRSARYGRAARISAAVALGSAVAGRVLAGSQRR